MIATKENYTVEHKIVTGSFGQKQDFLEFVVKGEDGQIMRRPFWGFSKVRDKVNDDYLDATEGYTQDDIEMMLEEQIQKAQAGVIQ